MEKVKEGDINEDKLEQNDNQNSENSTSKHKKFSDELPDRWAGVKRVLKPNKTKVGLTMIFLFFGVLFQIWSYKSPCLEIICAPKILGGLYYIIFPFDLVTILVLGNTLPLGPTLISLKILVIVLNIFYWYVLSGFISPPIEKRLKERKENKSKQKAAKEKAMKQAIAQHVKEAEEREKQKDLERLKGK